MMNNQAATFPGPLHRLTRTILFLAIGILSASAGQAAGAGDWPMWRYDSKRSGRSPEMAPSKPRLSWKKTWPALKPAYRSKRLQFDAGYEPIIMGELLFLASSLNDSVTAISLDDGSQAWRFYANGPVRFAPVAVGGRVYFGSDDGHLYCLRASSGKLEWKFRAAPSKRRLLGNGRLISAWPIRGGPVLQDGKIYFAAGVWSFEGVFVYCLDAASGKLSWLNDRSGYIYGPHPHGARAFGGLSPQGYLVVNGDELVVPCSAAYPARFDLATGKLKDFSLPGFSRIPGGWFAMADSKEAKDKRRGNIVLDSSVNKEKHEDRVKTGPGPAGASTTVELGGRVFSYEEELEGVEGTIHSIAAANQRLIVTTREGGIYCFAQEGAAARKGAKESAPPPELAPQWAARAKEILAAAEQKAGYCILSGDDAAPLGEAIASASKLQVVSFVSLEAEANKARARLSRKGLPGARVSIIQDSRPIDTLPPYFASLVILSGAELLRDSSPEELAGKVYRTLRPFGGTAVFDLAAAEAEKLKTAIGKLELSGSRLRNIRPGLLLLTRDGPLPGSTDYSGGWSSPDELVKAPLGVLWFDDSLGHFKRSPQPQFRSGIMISRPKDWHYPRSKQSRNRDYPLLKSVLSDIYTGRILAPDEQETLRNELARNSATQREPTQYRPPTQKNAWKPEKPKTGDRISPLTGLTSPRSFPKSYGCDGGINYGHIYSMRSGTAAFYDLRSESGTIHISGPRSGCTNSVIPAGGLLNIPYFYEGCTCSYPLPVGLALVNMPQEHEQWASWGTSKPSNIIRIGINLGAPGDRVDSNGTLWLDEPSVGGPSPEINVSITPPETRYRYRHSLWITGGRGWPWVCASGASGLSNLTLKGLRKGRFTLRLYFSEIEDRKAGERVFDIFAGDKKLLDSFDIAAQAGSPLRGVVKEFPGMNLDGTLNLRFSASRGRTLLCGIELIADHLDPGKTFNLKRKKAGHRLIRSGKR